jgi:hypothetical protein
LRDLGGIELLRLLHLSDQGFKLNISLRVGLGHRLETYIVAVAFGLLLSGSPLQLRQLVQMLSLRGLHLLNHTLELAIAPSVGHIELLYLTTR